MLRPATHLLLLQLSNQASSLIIAFNDVRLESSDELFKMLTEDKCGMFQHLKVLRNTAKMDLRITPVEGRKRA